MKTKTIYKNSWVTVSVPATFTGCMSVVFMVLGAVAIWRGKGDVGLQAIQLAFLLEIVDHLREDGK